MTTRALPILLLLVCWPSLTIAQAPPDKAAVNTLRAKIDEALKDPKLGTTRVGVHAIDLTTGTELYARDADGGYNPASNVKLVTSACALQAFGPSHQFRTELRGPEPTGTTLPGDLIIRGGAEPYLFYKHALEWGARLRDRGVKTITGNVVLDASMFRGESLPPGFEQKQEPGSYRAPIGALSMHLNAVRVSVAPGAKAGEPPKITLYPPNDYVKVVNQAVTSADAKIRLSVDSKPEKGKTVITVAGSIGATSNRPFFTNRRIDDPVAYTGAVIRHAFRRVGVKIKGKVRPGKGSKDKASLLVSHDSEPLSYLVAVMNKWSSNFIAEQLLRALGTTKAAGSDRGTWKGSKTALSKCLGAMKIDTAKVKILNGSGLYTGNVYSPRDITRVLGFMHTHASAPEYKASLAIAGVDGTLKERFKKTPAASRLRAKTGTLNNVTALSGYVTTAKGRQIAFSIMLNDTPKRSWRYRAVQDKVAAILAGFGE